MGAQFLRLAFIHLRLTPLITSKMISTLISNPLWAKFLRRMCWWSIETSMRVLLLEVATLSSLSVNLVSSTRFQQPRRYLVTWYFPYNLDGPQAYLTTELTGELDQVTKNALIGCESLILCQTRISIEL